MKTVLTSLNQTFDEVRAFTDSTIALNWITAHPSRWKTYARNRVQQIQENCPKANWFHVSGNDNPADCASRGITAMELLQHPLWWKGNSVMLMDNPYHPDVKDEETEATNREEQPLRSHHVQTSPPSSMFQNFSSFTRLQRVISWMFRFLYNCKATKSKTPLQQGSLTNQELTLSHDAIIRIIQERNFESEVKALQQGKEISIRSKILSLRPFLSSDGLLRVGGRLRNADISFERKHPLLLPRCDHVTTLLIRETHHRNLHAGPTSTLAVLNQRYWIVRGRDAVRFLINKCTTCIRHKATSMKQLMGDLPFDRVSPSRPFSKVGVDYAGPFITRSPGRSKITFKTWLSIFVCFATRALHIEVVSSLTTDGFLAALRRFISRRGRPTDIYSDNGTNFVGANKVLQDLELEDECSTLGIQWHFSPSGGPNFGGIWEAGVRSIKHHLYRVVGNSLLTYEEMLTLVTQIEAILNSRPIIPASPDPSDLQALTPAHFLIGAPITAIPDPDLTEIKPGRLDRWHFLQQQRQLFWRRWSGEFITRLQQRPKWCSPSPNLSVNDLVILKDERLPPMKWKLGRVKTVHPGADGLVRVATIKTSGGELKRPVSKLCLLPIHEDKSNQSIHE